MTIKHTRQLAQLITGRPTSDGAGVKLKRVLSPQHYRAFDPFLLLDEFGSDDAADYIAGFPEHPHRGFETVTYMLAGAMQHRDHLGNKGHLRAGSVQWMSAGRGVIHAEMPEQEDGHLHGFQLWINLPATDKMKPARYQEFDASALPCVNLGQNGQLKVIAGNFTANGKHFTGPIKAVSTQPIYFDVSLGMGKRLEMPVDAALTAMLYAYQGQLAVAGTDNWVKTGQLGLLGSGDTLTVRAGDENTRFLLMAALPLKEPMVQSGPFVMNTQEEIEQAFRDYRDGVLTD